MLKGTPDYGSRWKLAAELLPVYLEIAMGLQVWKILVIPSDSAQLAHSIKNFRMDHVYQPVEYRRSLTLQGVPVISMTELSKGHASRLE